MSLAGRGRQLVAVALFLTLLPAARASALPDERGWEMVSPVDKNGGRVAEPGEMGGVIQASPGGDSVTYGSTASFGDAKGAPPLSQYVARRTGAGWVTENISLPQVSGAYEGAPYLAFSEDLSRALHLNPSRCAVGDPCPPGYRLLSASAPVPSPATGGFAGADPALAHLAFLDGTDLGLWSPPAASLTPIADTVSAALAVSTGGTRVYWQGDDANLYLREGATVKQLDDTVGGEGAFQLSTPDGQAAFFTKAGHLYRYEAIADTAADLAPSGGVTLTLGSSTDGSRLFYLDASGLRRRQEGGGASQLLSGTLPGADPGTAKASADGSRLFFTTTRPIVTSDTNNDRDVYQWEESGTGSCAKAQGCTELISSGRAEGGAVFAAASSDGSSVFFVTDGSLVGADPGSFDLYVARVGGGFPDPVVPIPCNGDSCQSLPPEPRDPGLGTLFAGPGNPKVRYVRQKHRRGRCKPKAKSKRGRARCTGKARGGRRGGGR